MLSKLLALAGSLSLAVLAASTVYWAVRVTESQPPLPSAPQSPEARPDPGSTSPQSARTARPDVYYQASLDRPLFSPERRPMTPIASPPAPAAEPVAPEPVAESAVPPALRLLGVAGSNRGLSALISQGGEPSWVVAGAVLDGWTVTKIGSDWIELVSGSQRFRVEMYAQ